MSSYSPTGDNPRLVGPDVACPLTLATHGFRFSSNNACSRAVTFPFLGGCSRRYHRQIRITTLDSPPVNFSPACRESKTFPGAARSRAACKGRCGVALYQEEQIRDDAPGLAGGIGPIAARSPQRLASEASSLRRRHARLLYTLRSALQSRHSVCSLPFFFAAGLPHLMHLPRALRACCHSRCLVTA